MHKILIIEDEYQIAETLKNYLEIEGIQVKICMDSVNAVKTFDDFRPDLVILDLMLNKYSGETICESIKKKSTVPIIIVSAKSQEQDKLNLFYLGAADYVVKPFSIKELVARVHAVIRNHSAANSNDTQSEFDNGRLVIDHYSYNVFIDDEKILLTATEFKLLTIMANKPGKVFSRNALVWLALGYSFDGDPRIIDAHIRNLRKKIEKNSKHFRYIHTVIGLGYKFEVL
jgi:DNA-binding response OmpR family regulator